MSVHFRWRTFFSAARIFKRNAFNRINPVASLWSYAGASPSIVAIFGSYRLFGFCGRRRSCLCRKRAHKETARENRKSSDIGGADVSKIFERRFLVQGLPGGADDAADDDNLICIKDQDVATAFAIEAMRLTDHYNFRSVREPDIGHQTKSRRRSTTRAPGLNKFFDQDDIRCVEREILA